MKITELIYQVDDALGGPVLLVSADFLTLVDTSVKDSEGNVFALIEALGRKRSDLKNILITHSDGDHIGSLPALAAATNARIHAQALEAEVIRGQRPARSGQRVATPTAVDVIVREGDLLPLHGGIRVIETFGHTAGHVAYYLTETRTLIAGDCMVNTDGLAGSRPQYTFDTAQAIATVRKIADLAPDVLIFGHGEPITGGAAAKVKALANSFD